MGKGSEGSEGSEEVWGWAQEGRAGVGVAVLGSLSCLEAAAS